MQLPLDERRQIENEMIFRRANEKIGDGLDALDAMHIEDGNIHLVWNELSQLCFKCECSDEKCIARIPLDLDKYQQIHEDRSAFIVKVDHQTELIEKVVKKEKHYIVVRKNHSTPEPNSKPKPKKTDTTNV